MENKRNRNKVTVQHLEASRHCDCESAKGGRSRKQSQNRDCFVAMAPRNDTHYIYIKKKAFSLLELMLSCAVLIVILVSLIYTYIVCFELNEFSRNLTLANNALQAQLESIKEIPFDDLTNLDEDTFTLNGFSPGEAIGVVDVYDSAYADLKYIRLVACWRQRSGRIIGEDTNLDGDLQTTEDIDKDNIMDSPAEISTLINEVE